MGIFHKNPEAILFEVNIFPLRNMILFPGALMPLHIFEDRYKAMTEDSLAKRIPIATSHDPDVDIIVPGMICGGGKVTVVDEFPDHRKNILLEGNSRYRIKKILQEKPFLKVMAEKIEDVPFVNAAVESSYLEKLTVEVKRWIFSNPNLDDGLLNYIFIFEKPHQLADFIGGHFLPSLSLKQKLLEEPDQAKRVIFIHEFLSEQLKKFALMSEMQPGLFGAFDKSELH